MSKKQGVAWFMGLTALLVLAVLWAIHKGAMSIGILHFFSSLIHPKASILSEAEHAVLFSIRLPRITLALLVGAALSISGAVVQGVFRNPLADPGLIGISSGASLFAVIGIVMQPALQVIGIDHLGVYGLSIMAFLGAFGVTWLVYRLARVNGRTDIATMLLAGIAINALVLSITGLFTYLADDSQLRSITFWMMGSLGGASWTMVAGVAPFILLPLIILPFFAKALNVLAMGESNARYMGFHVERIKQGVFLFAALAVGASVAVSGVIGFLGLVVPHVIRLVMGPNHLYLIPASALLGAGLLVASDTVARTLLSPGELPIGIITSIMGAPVFLAIVLRERKTKRFV